MFKVCFYKTGDIWGQIEGYTTVLLGSSVLIGTSPSILYDPALFRVFKIQQANVRLDV